MNGWIPFPRKWANERQNRAQHKLKTSSRCHTTLECRAKVMVPGGKRTMRSLRSAIADASGYHFRVSKDMIRFSSDAYQQLECFPFISRQWHGMSCGKHIIASHTHRCPQCKPQAACYKYVSIHFALMLWCGRIAIKVILAPLPVAYDISTILQMLLHRPDQTDKFSYLCLFVSVRVQCTGSRAARCTVHTHASTTNL